MALEDVLARLADHWDDVLSRLAPDERRELLQLLDIVETGGDDGLDAALELMPLLVAALPPDHPVVRATHGVRLASGTFAVPEQLMRRLGALAAARATPAADALWDEARHRLLGAPSLGVDELVERGVDPALPDLIRLERSDGSVQFPAFQFAPGGAPREVVLWVNRELDVLDDPWGVADWWLGPNAWLRAVPAGLIGVVDDEVLVATARTAAED